MLGLPGDLKQHGCGKLGIWLAGYLKVQVALLPDIWCSHCGKPELLHPVKCLSN